MPTLEEIILAAFAAGSSQKTTKIKNDPSKKEMISEDVSEAASIIDAGLNQIENAQKKKPKRKPSAYAVKYGKAFKAVANDYKLKNGSWKKDGFKRAQKAAHKKVKSSTKKGQVRKTARRAYEKK